MASQALPASCLGMSSDRRLPHQHQQLSEAERLVLRRALEIVDSTLGVGGEADGTEEAGRNSSSSSSSRGPAAASGDSLSGVGDDHTPRRCRVSEQEARTHGRNEMSSCRPGASE